ncbi:MAG: hypothetical protein K0S55_1086 [Clostridia bacterium]|nr:hypothetical protein [Clostridia bacterium]
MIKHTIFISENNSLTRFSFPYHKTKNKKEIDKMSFSDINDHNCSAASETLEDKIKLLLTSISAEETKLASEIQAITEKIQSFSPLFIEQYDSNQSSTIINLIRYNINIEQKLKEIIKKEMNFQLELEKYLIITPNSSKTTESSLHDSAPNQTIKSDT